MYESGLELGYDIATCECESDVGVVVVTRLASSVGAVADNHVVFHSWRLTRGKLLSTASKTTVSYQTS